jgi:protein-disulfide isomerase
MRRTLFALALILTTASPSLADLTALTTEERTAFQAEIRAYLLENPEVLVEAYKVLQDREAETAAAQDQVVLSENEDFIFNDPASWVGGNPEGDLTVVEFMDYRCGYCRKAYDEVADLVATDGNIRFVVKEFPILGDDSIASSRFAIATRLLHGDAAYAAAHDALIALRGTPDSETLARLATDLGHDPQPLLDRMASEEVTAIISANHAIASQLNITGTPTFVVGTTLLRGYLPEEDMRKVVAEARGG